MDYLNNEALYKYFKDAINRESSAIIDQLKSEIDDLKTKAQENIKQELEEELDKQLAAKKQELNNEYQIKISIENNNIHQEIVQKRNQLIDQLFIELTNKLTEYIKGNEYKEKLSESLDKLDFKLYHLIQVSPNDLSWLKNKYQKLNIISDDTIFAGFKAVSNDQKIVFDQTYNEKIDHAKDWFYQNATWFI